MRTEHDLRVSLNELAEQPTPTGALFESITDHVNGHKRKPRPAAFVLAMTAVVLVLAIAIPQFLSNRDAVPADTRRPGNWNSSIG